MRFPLTSTIALATCLWSLPAMAQWVPQRQALDRTPGSAFSYFGRDIESACGQDWYVLDVDALRWSCARPAPDGFEVLDQGSVVGPSLYFVRASVRGPIPQDRKIRLAGKGLFGCTDEAVDPVSHTITLQISGNCFRSGPIFVDLDDDGFAELLPFRPTLTQVPYQAAPGGSLPAYLELGTIPTGSYLAGQFDADEQLEIGSLVGGTLLFTDSRSFAAEAWTPPGFYSPTHMPYVGDWDLDGRDELGVSEADGATLALLDPDRPQATVRVSAGADAQVLGTIQWSGGAESRALVLVARSRGMVVDPHSGRILHDQPVQGLTGRAARMLGYAVDWDGDGDEDYVWNDRDGPSTWLLRNPEGFELLDGRWLVSRLLGYVGSASERAVVLAEGLYGASPLRITLLGAGELETRSTFLLERSGLFLGSLVLGRTKPGDDGWRLLDIAPGALRLHALDGSLQWSSASDGESWSARSAALPSDDCSADCGKLAVADEGSVAGTWRLRVLDARTGTTRSSRELSATALEVKALLDLDHDGVLDLVVHRRTSTGAALESYRSDTLALAHQLVLPTAPNVVDVKPGGAALGLLLSDGSLMLADPANLGFLASRKIAPGSQCQRTCSLAYVDGEPAQWLAMTPWLGIASVRADLRGPVTISALPTSSENGWIQSDAPGEFHALFGSRAARYTLVNDAPLIDGFEGP